MENQENNESVNIIEQLERIRTATILASKTVYNTAEACEYMGIKKNLPLRTRKGAQDKPLPQQGWKAPLLQAQRPRRLDAVQLGAGMLRRHYTSQSESEVFRLLNRE